MSGPVVYTNKFYWAFFVSSKIGPGTKFREMPSPACDAYAMEVVSRPGKLAMTTRCVFLEIGNKVCQSLHRIFGQFAIQECKEFDNKAGRSYNTHTPQSMVNVSWMEKNRGCNRSLYPRRCMANLSNVGKRVL